ncbi:MAG: hypothetical protein ACKO1M_05665, partial [Planctomycetota bacterium]
AHLVTLEMVRRNFIDNPEEALKKVLGAFDRRVKECPGHDFGKAQTPQGAGILQNWLAGRLATEEKGGMSMTLPGHETIAASFDLYVKKRHAEDPNTPKDGAAWLETLKPIKDAGEWKKHFSEPLGRWAAWFRPQFEKQWQEYAEAFAGPLKTSPQVRIDAITSLAYDEAGKEYPVPLVVFDGKSPPQRPSGGGGQAASKSQSSSSPAVGPDDD